MERTSVDACMELASTEFQYKFQTRGVHLTLAAPEHHKMNGQVEVTCRTLRSIAHSFMVHARVSEASIHFILMYVADHIYPVLPIKDLINEYGELTMQFKIATSMKPSI